MNFSSKIFVFSPVAGFISLAFFSLLMVSVPVDDILIHLF